MAKLLFHLRNVPEDEADDVRGLLTRQGFDWYETRPSPWGISHGALWLREASDYGEARRVLDHYQHARREQAHEQLRLQGRERFIDLLRERPGYVWPRLLAIVGIVLLVLALPWLLLG